MPAVGRKRRSPQARVGEDLAFSRELQRRDAWPSDRIVREHTDLPAATPYIVLPAGSNDLGGRPLPGADAMHSAAIDVVDAVGNAVSSAVPRTAYELRATLRNVGAAPSYAGVMEFFVGGPAAIDAAAVGTASLPCFAIEGFVAHPDSSVTVSCRRPWVPADADEAAASIVVHAYDLLLDPLTRRFDARADRHVARKDLVPDFAGTWEGTQHLVGTPAGSGWLYRVAIEQRGMNVSARFFEEVADVAIGRAQPSGPGGGPVLRQPRPGIPRGLPVDPQLTGAATIAGGQVQLSIIGFNGVDPFTADDVTLSLLTPDTLHVVQHTRFVAPGDGRGPMDLEADLARVT